MKKVNTYNRKCYNIIIFFFLIVISSLSFSSCREPRPQNKYPIILLHGIMGWERDEMFGFKYWGGINDLQLKLREEGYEVYTVTVGPFSSNWDRACEAYAKIKGVLIDYGLAHSRGNTHTARYLEAHNISDYKEIEHERFFRSDRTPEKGIIPDWGKKKPDGSIKKIHIISHSMGGQTARLLIHLLNNGSDIEKSTDYSHEDIPMSDLFKGGNDWVASLVTISTPHDGTTLAEIVPEFMPKWLDILAAFSSVYGISDNYIFDLKLDHFGFKRKENESYSKYFSRVRTSEFFKNKEIEDFSSFDLKPLGASILNSWVKTSKNVYSFSIATEATEKNKETGFEEPELTMFPPFQIFSTRIGRYKNRGSDWFKNDGVVNTISMDGPTLNSDDKIVVFDLKNITNQKPKKGVWNYCGVKEGWDHYDIIGGTHTNPVDFVKPVTKFYTDILKAVSLLN